MLISSTFIISYDINTFFQTALLQFLMQCFPTLFWFSAPFSTKNIWLHLEQQNYFFEAPLLPIIHEFYQDIRKMARNSNIWRHPWDHFKTLQCAALTRLRTTVLRNILSYLTEGEHPSNEQLLQLASLCNCHKKLILHQLISKRILLRSRNQLCKIW